MSNPAEFLIERGAPNNILTRTIYRTIHRLLYITLSIGLTIVSVVTRKDQLELLNALSIKLGLGPIDPVE